MTTTGFYKVILECKFALKFFFPDLLCRHRWLARSRCLETRGLTHETLAQHDRGAPVDHQVSVFSLWLQSFFLSLLLLLWFFSLSFVFMVMPWVDSHFDLKKKGTLSISVLAFCASWWDDKKTWRTLVWRWWSEREREREGLNRGRCHEDRREKKGSERVRDAFL